MPRAVLEAHARAHGLLRVVNTAGNTRVFTHLNVALVSCAELQQEHGGVTS